MKDINLMMVFIMVFNNVYIDIFGNFFIVKMSKIKLNDCLNGEFLRILMEE